VLFTQTSVRDAELRWCTRRSGSYAGIEPEPRNLRRLASKRDHGLRQRCSTSAAELVGRCHQRQIFPTGGVGAVRRVACRIVAVREATAIYSPATTPTPLGAGAVERSLVKLCRGRSIITGMDGDSRTDFRRGPSKPTAAAKRARFSTAMATGTTKTPLFRPNPRPRRGFLDAKSNLIG